MSHTISTLRPRHRGSLRAHAWLIALLGAAVVPAPAGAEPLVGSISDPSLRRGVDLVYLEHSELPFSPPARPVAIVVREHELRPHVLSVLVGTHVVLEGKDADLELLVARIGRRAGVFHVTSRLHRDLSAYVVVLENPFFTRIDRRTGRFVMADVPPGHYSLRIWGERLSEAQNALRFPVVVEPSMGPGSNRVALAPRGAREARWATRRD
jgi:hypothetical protein